MDTRAQTSTFLSRIVLLAGLAGILIGVLIGALNQDDVGWSLFRGALLGICFSWIARQSLRHFLRAWLESRIETLSSKQEEVRKENKPKNKPNIKK